MEPTYAFKNGNVYTISDGKVVASVKEADFMEPVDNLGSDPEVQLPDPPDDLQEDMLADIVECPACGNPSDSSDSFCSKCGEPLGDGGLAGLGEDVGFGDDMLNARMVASVTSPNGLEGKVVNRTPSLWGEEVTVRFANGRVKTMPVTADMEFTKEAFEFVPGAGSPEEAREMPEFEKMKGVDSFEGTIPCLTDEECSALGLDPNNPRPLTPEEEEALARFRYSSVASLRAAMNASVPGDLKSLRERKAALKAIQHKVANRISKASAKDKTELDQIALEAKAESREIDDAIQHIAELEGREFIPTAPFKSSAVESAELGRTDGSWLHEVVANMNAEARGTDYGKLMNEGPEIFVAGSDDALVSDAAATRQAATRYVRSFTSAAVDSTTDQQRAKFETQFLARVEECRKGEQSSRKQAARKEASSVAESAVNAPDDSLFL